MIPLKSPKIGYWRKTYLSVDLRISKNILQIGETTVSKFKFMHTLSESKSIFAIEQKAIVSCFVKMLRFYWDTRYMEGVYSPTEGHVKQEEDT